MKLTYISVFVLFAAILRAGDTLFCESPVKDFGIIEESERFSHTFIIKNVSEKIVEVDKTISSCGCIVTTKKEFVLGPQESTDINIEFNSHGVGGLKIIKTISVCPKDDNDSPLILTIKADVKGIPPEKRIIIEPHQKTIEGEPDKKYSLRMQIPSDPNIKFSIDVPEWLGYSLQKSRYNNYANIINWDIEVYLKAKQKEKLSGGLVVNSNVPRFEKVTVPIQVVPKPNFIISPYMIIFDSNEVNQSREVSIKPNDCSLESVRNSLEFKSSKECIKTSWTTEGNDIHLKVINNSCSPESGKIEIKAENEILGSIPVIFKK